MDLTWPADTSSSWMTFSCLLLGTAFYLLRWFDSLKYKSIPAIGPSAPLISYWGALKFFRNGKDMVQEGYNKYRGGVFRVANHNRWHLVVTGTKLIEELRRAPDDVLSFHEAINEAAQVQYTIGPSVVNNGYHIPVIRNKLTRNIVSLLPDIRDELAAACSDMIPATDEWVKVPALQTIMSIVARTSSRVFVGLPLCRNREYNEISVNYAIDVVLGARIINLFPKILRPIVAKFLIRAPKTALRAQRHLEPIIRERFSCMEKYGREWADRPNDMLQWLMEEAVGEEKEPRLLTLRVLTVNFAAIHTSSMSFTHALYRLQDEWRWTKAALQKMHRVDSFLKECQRFYGLGCLTMTRKALRDFAFADGTVVPRGAHVSVASAGTRTDGAFYADPLAFDPWRFSDMHGKAGGSAGAGEGEGEGTKHQMVHTTPEYVAFGLGRHACPGRFFAANELKMLLVHVVLHYDVAAERPGVVPDPLWYTSSLSPNRTAAVLFRKRRTAAA